MSALKLKKSPAVSPESIEECLPVFSVADDRTRVQILVALQAGEMNVLAICGVLGREQPVVSHHLQLMRASRVVDYHRRGKCNYYHLMPRGRAILRAMAEIAGEGS